LLHNGANEPPLLGRLPCGDTAPGAHRPPEDGSWPLQGWIKSSGSEDAAYGTAYATMTLFVTDARLSIYNRTPPKLPRGAGKE
jgi:hypothetical protein